MDDLDKAGGRLAAAHDELDAARHAAQQAATAALEAGLPETRIAAALGIDRSTLRKWLGK